MYDDCSGKKVLLGKKCFEPPFPENGKKPTSTGRTGDLRKAAKRGN